MPDSSPPVGRPHRGGRLAVLVVGIAAASLIIAYLGVSAVIADRMSRPERHALVGTPADYGLRFESVDFTSREDAIPLKGWWMPAAGSSRAVVIVHGRNSNRSPQGGQLLPQARDLVNAGFNVLSFDLRAHGESGGIRYSLGPFERRDVLAAVDYVRDIRGIPSGRIALACHSMGAATCLLTAPEAPDVGAVISDSAYARLTDLLGVELPKQTHLPAFFGPGILFMGDALYGIDVTKAAPEEVVGTIRPRPILFIHGLDDTYVPPEQARRLLLASGEGSEALWLVPGVVHDRAFTTHPDEYRTRMVGFLNAAMP